MTQKGKDSLSFSKRVSCRGAKLSHGAPPRRAVAAGRSEAAYKAAHGVVVARHVEDEDFAGPLEHQPPLQADAALEPVVPEFLRPQAGVQMGPSEHGGNAVNDPLRGGEIGGGQLPQVF